MINSEQPTYEQLKKAQEYFQSHEVPVHEGMIAGVDGLLCKFTNGEWKVLEEENK